MSDNVIDQFRQQEADGLALGVQLNRWSLALMEQMIADLEQKLVASDLPVDAESADPFWEELA